MDFMNRDFIDATGKTPLRADKLPGPPPNGAPEILHRVYEDLARRNQQEREQGENRQPPPIVIEGEFHRVPQ